MQLKCIKKICAVCGEGAVSDQTCRKWFVKFCAGDFSLDNAPSSYRPVEVNSDQIETLTENNQCHTTREIAQNIQINKVIGENEKCVFYEKTKWAFWPNQYYEVLVLHCPTCSPREPGSSRGWNMAEAAQEMSEGRTQPRHVPWPRAISI